jgi:hypothetical protein
MPRFRSKPREFYAEQWFPGKFVEGVLEVPPVEGQHNGFGLIKMGNGHSVAMIVNAGDWIVPSTADGQPFPISQENFELANDPFPESPADDEIHRGRVFNGFDYRLQIWVKQGVVLTCNHPESMRAGSQVCCDQHRYAGRSILELEGAEEFPTEARTRA